MWKDSFRELLTRTIPESLILFDQEFCKQHDGIEMSSLSGRALLNVFLCCQEKVWLQNCLFEFKPVAYRRYAVNTFLLFDLKYYSNKSRNYLNFQHKNDRLISETGNENSISFLDIKISTANNKLTNSVHRKPTFTRVFLNFGSLILKSYKYNLLFTLFTRAFKL